MLAIAALAISVEKGPRLSAELAIRRLLPDNVGEFRGVQAFYCHNEQCLKRVIAADLSHAGPCPACGGELHSMTLAEKNTLPADTEISKKEYTDQQGRTISISIVISGYEQRSIHRPQQCLPALGHTIERSRTLPVPLPGRQPLQVMFLDLRGTESPPRFSEFAYWFVSGNRETPSHLERLWWMSVDRIVHNVARRWAYVAVATDRRQGSDEYELLRTFIAKLYPVLVARD